MPGICARGMVERSFRNWGPVFRSNSSQMEEVSANTLASRPISPRAVLGQRVARAGSMTREGKFSMRASKSLREIVRRREGQDSQKRLCPQERQKDCTSTALSHALGSMLYCFTKHGRDFTATTEGAKKALKGEAEHANSEVWGSFWLFVCKKYKQWTSHGEKVKVWLDKRTKQ